MSTVSLRDRTAKEFELTIHLSLREAARIGRDRLVGSRGRLVDRADGGVDVSLTYYVRAKAEAARLVALMLFFGEGGAFEAGAVPDPEVFPAAQPDSGTIQTVTDTLGAWTGHWRNRWQTEVELGLRERQSRLEMMRRIRDRFGDAVSESLVRAHLLHLLRKHHTSEMFAATCLWRMGWDTGEEAALRACALPANPAHDAARIGA